MREESKTIGDERRNRQDEAERQGMTNIRDLYRGELKRTRIGSIRPEIRNFRNPASAFYDSSLHGRTEAVSSTFSGSVT